MRRALCVEKIERPSAKEGRFVDKAVILWYAVTGGASRPSGAVPTNAGRVAAPSIRFVPWAALASYWPLPQPRLPVSAAGSGRLRCG